MNQRLASLFGAPIRSRLIDRGVVVLIFLFGVAASFAIPATGSAPITRPVALALTVWALLLRHRRPVATLALILFVAAVVNYPPVVMLPALLAMFTVTTDCEPPSIIGGAAATALVLLLTPELHGRSELNSAQIISRVVVIGLVVAFGLYLRARAAYINELRERAQHLSREQELDAARAVADERVRIARELHDVVAHNVSLMVVQAQAAAASAANADKDPALQLTLARVGNLGREALSEMHRMLGVLRVGDASESELQPQPGVRELDALIASPRDAGLDTSLEVTGSPYELPPGVDLSAYRIVQEALTNVVRHAHATSATVRLDYTRHGLELTISDDGVGDAAADPATRAGHGLVGMRERVGLFGGELTTGNNPNGLGYRVHAVLPVTAAGATSPDRPTRGQHSGAPTAPASDSAALVSAVLRRVT